MKPSIHTPDAKPLRQGHIEVITGCMFSGKTDELITRIVRAEIAKQQILNFKHSSSREPFLLSRSGSKRLNVHVCPDSGHVNGVIRGIDHEIHLITFDEVQFFDAGIIETITELADLGIRVVCTGLDTDYAARPWPIMAHLISIAEYVDKVHAICVQCGAPATRTQRLIASSEQVLIETSGNEYEARCRHCHTIPTC